MTANSTPSRDEITVRGLHGTKWILLTNLAGLPFSFLINVLLGRTSPEALGNFAISQIFISIILSVALFGGENTLRNFIPQLSDTRSKGQFVFTYLFLSIAFLSLLVLVSGLVPGSFESLLGQEVSRGYYPCYLAFAFLIVWVNVGLSTSLGLLQIKHFALCRFLLRVFPLIVIAPLYIWARPFLKTHSLDVIFGTLFVAYTIAGVILQYSSAHTEGVSLSMGWVIPKGFILFALTSYVANVAGFFFQYLDRICVLRLGDPSELGKYQAVINVVLLIDYFPRMLGTAFIPSFSALLVLEKRADFEKAFLVVFRNSVIVITFFGLFFMSFSRETLLLFGPEYPELSNLLTLFSFACILQAPAHVSFAIFTTMNKNRFRFFLALFQIAVQVGGTLLFMERYGLYAIAGARVVSLVAVSVIATVYTIYGLRMSPSLPRSFRGSLISSSVVLIWRCFVGDGGLMGSVLLFLGAVTLFVAISRLTFGEIRGVYQAVFHSKGGSIWTDQGTRERS